MAEQGKEATKKAPARGNKTTEIIIGSSAAKLAAGVAALTQAAEIANKLNDVVAENTLKVVDLEDKIGGLEQDFKNKVAQGKVELEIAYTTNKKAFADDYARVNGLTYLPTEELSTLRGDNAKLKQDQAAEIQKAVGAAVGIAKAEATNAAKILELEHKNTQSANTAEIGQLKNEVTFLKDQVKMWQDALTAERNAGVERAKAGAVGTINVGDVRK